MVTKLRTRNLHILESKIPSLSEIFYTSSVDVDSAVGFNVQIDYTSTTIDMLTSGSVEVSNDMITWSKATDFNLSGTSNTCNIFQSNIMYAYMRIKFQLLKGSPTIDVQARVKGF